MARESNSKLIALGCEVEPALGKPTPRTAEVEMRFGLSPSARRIVVVKDAGVEVAPGRIVLLTGPSGSGKTLALQRMGRAFAGMCDVNRLCFPRDIAVVDAIAPGAPLADAIGILTACSLAEPRLWLQCFEALSEGEKFRARLARAMGGCLRGWPSLSPQSCPGKRGSTPRPLLSTACRAPLFCDEFGSLLHRRLAKVISFNLRKLVTRRGLAAIVATSQDDIVADLQPDAVVRLCGKGRATVEERVVAPRPISFRRRLRIEPGRKADYSAFADMHYRHSEELGFVDKVFVLRDGTDGQLLGVVVYAYGPVELALRNRATHGRYAGHPHRLNREMRILRRVVIHPDVRGCGLGHHLVRQTLPLVGTNWVECLAAMGEFNPVFEKAGMRRVDQYETSPRCQAAVEALSAVGVAVMDRSFPLQVARRPEVREIVEGVVREWYAGTTGSGQDRAARQSAEFLAQAFRGLVGLRPVYYLWQRDKAA